MLFPIGEKDFAALSRFLDTDEDCERLAGAEYVADLYEHIPPVTIHLTLDGGKVAILAAAELVLDEELDAYYMGEQIEAQGEIFAALMRAARRE